MKNNYYISSYCHIKNNTVRLNGNIVYHDNSETFSEFIKNLYRAENTKYAKFFKMDNLSKLAFMAADIILKNENLNTDTDNNIALVFSNKAASLDTDRKHQTSIQDKQDYYPSPAVFVYTLPNICLGEISIKYKLFSENSFFIFDSFNADHLFNYSNSLLDLNKSEAVLSGWVDFDDTNYEAFLYLVSRSGGGTIHDKQNIITLYNR
ncbi:3-oxoacyl-ACP synthase [Hanstruepera marina]|uniref:3-oxoacyl-ACP synthase n=1 Tax=Hanstruepera marina TaxID=2873265 RepID=UPI001CA79D4F|nr:3-oxoacyl-ACP synthase [Hanstruepera marina]